MINEVKMIIIIFFSFSPLNREFTDLNSIYITFFYRQDAPWPNLRLSCVILSDEETKYQSFVI